MSVIRPDFYDFGISSSTAYALKRRTNKLEFTVDIHILNTGIFKDSRFLRLT